MLIDIIGWTGNLIFAISGIPQAYKSIKQGHARGVSHTMLWLWAVGEILAMIYAYLKLLPLPLLLNYLVNVISLVIILRYRYFPKN